MPSSGWKPWGRANVLRNDKGETSWLLHNMEDSALLGSQVLYPNGVSSFAENAKDPSWTPAPREGSWFLVGQEPL